jgi:hypothetical protein
MSDSLEQGCKLPQQRHPKLFWVGFGCFLNHPEFFGIGWDGFKTKPNFIGWAGVV